MNSIPPMTTRERMTAATEFRDVDHLPFWPKVGQGYNVRNGTPVFDGMDFPGGLPRIGQECHRTCSVSQTKEGDNRTIVYGTPLGRMTERIGYDPESCSTHPLEFPVKTVDDVRAMTAFHDDIEVVLNEEAAATHQQARTTPPQRWSKTGIGISPLMRYLEHLAGVDVGHYLLADHPAEVEALFASMQRILAAQAELLAEHSAADIHVMVENTSTTLISPDQYRRHCLPSLQQIRTILTGGGKRMELHMCGFLKNLLSDVEQVKADAFEALTPPPVGDTTFAAARGTCPTVCLVGGTGAVTWLKSSEEIIEEIEGKLDALPHHRGIVVSSGGMLPPQCPPETVRAVHRWLCDYTPRF